MYLTSLIHRDRLFQIACRWLGDRLEPDDGRALTEIFIFEQPVITPSMVEIMGDIYREIHPDGIQLRRITSKDELRRAIVAGCADPDERMKALFDRYDTEGKIDKARRWNIPTIGEDEFKRRCTQGRPAMPSITRMVRTSPRPNTRVLSSSARSSCTWACSSR